MGDGVDRGINIKHASNFGPSMSIVPHIFTSNRTLQSSRVHPTIIEYQYGPFRRNYNNK